MVKLKNRFLVNFMSYLILYLLIALILPVHAVEYKPGVKIGQSAEYAAITSGDNIDRMHLAIYGIVGTEITLNITTYNESVMDSTSLVTGDISNSSSSLIVMFVIAAGLSSGEKIFPDADWIINETLSETWSGLSRQINHFNTANGLFEAWWDQETGLVVKVNFWIFGWVNLTMTSTDAWVPPELFSTTNLLLGAMGVETLVIIALLVRGRGKKSQKK